MDKGTVYRLTPPPLEIRALEILAGGDARVTFSGVPGEPYLLEATADLASPSWTPVASEVVGPDGSAYCDDPDASLNARRIYSLTPSP